MQPDQHYLGAYWGPRPETPASAASQLAAMVAALAPLGPAFDEWVVGEDDPLPEGDALTAWLIPQFDPAVSGTRAELGASFWALTEKGRGPSTLELQATVGLHATGPLGNTLVLGPRDDDAVEVLPSVATEVLVAVVGVWNPDWAVVTSRTLRKALVAATGRPRGGFLGPVTWHHGWEVPETDGVIVTEVAGGQLVDARALADDDLVALAQAVTYPT